MKPAARLLTPPRPGPPSASGPIRAFQWDLARQVERLDVLIDLLPQYAEWGYQELYLHLEDAVEFPSLPDVARPDAYRYSEMQKLVAVAQQVGIGVVPIVNLLGHTQYLIKTKDLRELNELQDEAGNPLVQGQICPLHPRTLQVAASLMDDVRPFCTAGKIHVGLDESFHLGKCPRCRVEIAERGLAYHFSSYVNRLHTLTSARQLRLGMWADMLNFIPAAIAQLPSGIIAYDWYYYPFARHPRVELFNFAESDLATPLKKQGIEYWGCPMNGVFRYEPLPLFKDRLGNLRSWWQRCHRVEASGFLVTSWEAYRLAFPLTTVVDAAAAELWQKSKDQSDLNLLSAGFSRVFGPKSARKSAALALGGDEYPFAGYAAWELNDRWDVAGELGLLHQAKKTVAALQRITRRARSSPPALRESLAFRLYLAERSVFVQQAADSVFRLRRLLRAGKLDQVKSLLIDLQDQASHFALRLSVGHRAAQKMWRLSRRSDAPSQNGEILHRDRGRLREWRNWLRVAHRAPELSFGSTLVCGVYQLVFTVHNFAPAAQGVSVEQRQPDGTWTELRSRHTIEFQADSAQRRSQVRRGFSTPLGKTLPPLRLVLRGAGEVKIEKIFLTDGVQPLLLRKTKLRLGHPAPRSGLPDVFAISDTHELEIKKPRRGRGFERPKNGSAQNL